MLKITVLDGPQETRFRLEGKLSGPWVAELRQCWDTAGCAVRRRAVLDLNEVDFVDPEGQALLVDLHKQGARLMASQPFIHSIVAAVCRACRCATVEEGSPQNPHAVAERTGEDQGAS